MTTLILPNEILNKIFSYIEGKHNQIIKKKLINTDYFWIYKSISIYNKTEIHFAFDKLKYNLLSDKQLSNNKMIEYNKYFKYSVLHLNRKYVFDDIKFSLRALIDDFNYYNKYYNYTKILQQVRKNYIDDYNYKYNFQYFITNKQFQKHYNVYFKYTILHENRKKVFNNIKRYYFKKHYIFNKKLSKKILLERGILFQQLNNKR